MPLPTYKHNIFAKGAKRNAPSFYKGIKKLGPSFYGTAAKKGLTSPEQGKDNRSGVEKGTRKSTISIHPVKHRSKTSEYKGAKNGPPKADKTKKVSIYGHSKRLSDYKVIKTPQQTSLKESTSKRAAKKPQKGSVMNLNRLRKDGRKTPDDYRQTALAAQSPSQLSLRSISELYALYPYTDFAKTDDVFKYRGYKKIQKIDEGAFGVVSKAMRLSDRTLVAVKEVDLRRKRAKRIEEMKRELFVLQKVDDEHVVKLIEHFIIDQMLVIIMEFCAGGNLTAYLKETAINEQEALFLFKQMALSIKVLHRKGIAHRDVKLNNFLLDSTRKLVKIGDFGLSVVSYRPHVGILMAKTYCGTEPYMAPEILKRNSLGIRQYNPIYADIWSLGICLFAMLTRTFPFKMHTSQHGLFKAQVTRRWRFPRSLRDMLSEEIKDLVWHMLDPDPERRITINGIIAHPWLNHNQLLVLSYGESETESTYSSIR